MKKQILLLALLLSVTASALAVEAEIDGLWYELIPETKEATVIQYKNSIHYSGNIVIPATVDYNGANYCVTSIGKRSFSGCSNLTSVTIPNSVTSIGGSAFQGCRSLTSVTIPNSVTSIGEQAFNGTPWYDNWYNSQPDGLLYRNYILWGYKGDKPIGEIVIDGTTRLIADGTFSGCSDLTSVTIPNSVTSIGDDAFHGCIGLTSIMIPNNVISIGESAFMGCIGLTSLTIPNSVTTIGGEAFENCEGLTSVIIGNGVTTIGGEAFKDCYSLIAVVIGSGVTTIMGQAFGNCKKITDVYCYAETVPTAYGNTVDKTNKTNYYNAFEKTNIENATLHVPANSINDYKGVEPWKNFKSIVGWDGTLPEELETMKCATPTITFVDGKLKFSCETEDVEYVSEVTSKEVKKYYSDEVAIVGTYTVSVYAMKTGYDNSDVATMEFTLGAGGEVCDVNKDGAVDVADISTIIDRMAGK